ELKAIQYVRAMNESITITFRRRVCETKRAASRERFTIATQLPRICAAVCLGALMQPPKASVLEAHGARMPAIGFGTMELPHRPAELVAAAIEAGYRHIDTARKYGTEEDVGEGIRASGLARSELFVTTKVTEGNAREVDFLRSAETSLRALGLDYVDLLLVHWPQPKVPFSETLGALAKAKRSGMTRHIGVSNFTLAMLDEAVRVCLEPLVTNQIEYHAYLPQDRMIAA